MTDFHYEPLSYLDASFLALETGSAHMHVTGVALFDAAPLKADDGGIDIERIKAHVHSKLQYIPRYRQRLDWVPYDRRPVWVDDQHFDFDIAMGVAKGDEALREELDSVLGRRQAEVAALLADYRVPSAGLSATAATTQMRSTSR